MLTQPHVKWWQIWRTKFALQYYVTKFEPQKHAAKMEQQIENFAMKNSTVWGRCGVGGFHGSCMACGDECKSILDPLLQLEFSYLQFFLPFLGIIKPVNRYLKVSSYIFFFLSSENYLASYTLRRLLIALQKDQTFYESSQMKCTYFLLTGGKSI